MIEWREEVYAYNIKIMIIHCSLYWVQKMGQCEYELVQLKAAAEGRCTQVIALVDLQATFTYALKVCTSAFWIVLACKFVPIYLQYCQAVGQ